MAEMKSPQTREKAEILALEGLTWLAGQEDGLRRFLDQSGIDAPALKAGAGSPEMGTAILDFLLANEDLLLGFCESAAVEPQALHMALHRLGGAA
jgi:hypothetical protein